MSQPLPIPPYSRPPGDRRPIVGLWVGLIAGAAVSVIVWVAAWRPIMEGRHPIAWPIAIPMAKMLVAAILMGFARTRIAGAGVLISVSVGLLIFFGSCFAHLAR